MIAKGYQELQRFVTAYAAPALEGDHRPPDLELSLTQLRAVPGFGGWLSCLGIAPRCLIEGYVSPRNGPAVRRVLASCGVSEPRIEAFDLFDVGSLYRSLGWEAPDLPVHVADACRLQAHYADASVDLVIQDFLLNCAPLADHRTILQEAARVLHPEGLLIISFTDSGCLAATPHLDPATLAEQHGLGWSDTAYNLADLAGPVRAGALLPQLGGLAVSIDRAEGAAWICRSTGRFEFFRPFARTSDLLDQCGFVSVLRCTSTGFDNHGLHCRRHHCLYRRDGSRGIGAERLS